MKILHVIIGLERGGAELMLKRLVLEQAEMEGTQPTIVSLTDLGAIGGELRSAGIDVRVLGLRNAGNAIAVVSRLALLIRSLKPDVVQTWMYHADLLGGLAARLAGHRNIIWGIRNTDLYHGAGVSKSLRWIMWICAKLSSSIPSAIVCVAEAARKSHARFGYDAAKMCVISNGFPEGTAPSDRAKSEARSALGIGDEALVIGSVGRFNAYKDHQNFVHAMEMVAQSEPQSLFLMVGRDVDSSNPVLQGWIEATACPQAYRTLGERKDVALCFAAMDIFCLHSKSEGFPNVLAEAMMAGVASVATDVGDARLLGEDLVAMVPPGNPAALAEAVVRLLELSKADRDSLGQGGRNRIAAAYSLERTADRYHRLYDQILRSKFPTDVNGLD